MLNAGRPPAVSYTHLDVYKRQPLRNERTPSFKVNDRLNEWYDFGAATGGDLVEPVSYTHLDVYKRQDI